jgi:hypothetical protein
MDNIRSFEMKKLRYTKREAIRLHRKQWRELAENGNTEKAMVEAKQNCFVCQYDNDMLDQNPGNKPCTFCPLDWPRDNQSTYAMCVLSNGLFTLWRNEKDKNKRKELALRIANLPVRRAKK